MKVWDPTFVAVVLGAVVATFGGFAATQVGIWLDRARDAKSAALLCGEILAAIGALLRLAEDAAGQSTFFNPLTSRLLTAARREIDVYDRNRELLFHLRDADLRARLHSFIIRLSIPLDRLADHHGRYRELCLVGETAGREAELLRAEIDSVFGCLIRTRGLIPGLLAILQKRARTRFELYDKIDSDGIPVGSDN